MSAGELVPSKYQSNTGLVFKIKLQPETLSLTLNGVANEAPAGPVGNGLPSAIVSGGRRSKGVNCRLVRVKFTGTLPDGYKTGGILTLPVLQQSVYNSYDADQVGTYTLNGTAYDVIVVGKTPESIR